MAAYPNSPIHSGTSTTIANFNRVGVKQWYQDHVLDGEFENPDFNESNYDYGAVPESIPAHPEGENPPGQAGSTIVSSGKGPNVGTIDRGNIQDSSFVDATPTSSTPFEGVGSDLSPKDSSVKTAAQTIVTPPARGSSGAN